MNSANDSVILCDTPSPAKPRTWMDELFRRKYIPNFTRQLRSSSAKSLLSTVYESPLMHFTRNKIRAADKTIEINDVTIVHSPPTKRRKTRSQTAKKKESDNRVNLEESVVIVNDTITPEPHEKPASVVEVGLSDTEANDVIEVLEANNVPEPVPCISLSNAKNNDKIITKSLQVKLVKYKGGKGKKKNVNLKNSENLKVARAAVDALNVNDENHNGQIMEKKKKDRRPAANGEAEDVEVVWVSGPESNQGAANADNPFVVDTMPSLTNLVNEITLKGNKKRKRLEQRKKFMKKRGRFDAAASNCTKQPEKQNDLQPEKLREIVIDGPNVGMGHTCGKSFSEKGLKLVIDYFKKRGHVVKAFLPQMMRTRDRVLLEQLHREGTVVFTPSRRIGGKTITPYDDRYILDYATQCDGIVVSSDQYRDLWHEKPQWRNTIEKRLLTPTFAGDYLMFPEDPLGRSGPKLDEFLRH